MANHITRLRKMAGIKTAKEAALLLKISPGMMYQMEEGSKSPSVKLACKMARLFHCSLDEIIMPIITTKSYNASCNK